MAAENDKEATTTEEVSYEEQRRRNILRNEEEMRRLGLDVSALTNKALGRFAPTRQTSRRAVRRPKPREPTRRSERIAGASPDYADVPADLLDDDAPPPRKKSKSSPSLSASSCRNPSLSASSCRNLATHSLEVLRDRWLGREIAGVGGTQMKRGVMEALSAEGAPTFSRMSGIQEWRNAVCLFVNVYGDGYKNAFLREGRQITWFAQARQWEGTPVIQRLVNCHGGDVLRCDEEDVVDTLEPTDVLLFCREENKPFVFCGALDYVAHDAHRIPVRFVWELLDFDALSRLPAFAALVASCNALLQPPPAK